MSTAFAITAATTTVRLDAARTGEAQFTVTNTSGRPLRARLRAVPLQPEAEGWFIVAGAPERPFALGETQQVAVGLAPPPQAAAGSYAVRLDAAAEDNPDDDSVQGPSVTIEIPAPVAKKPFPWWIVGVAAAVLLIAGAAAFFLLRDDGGTEVPNVVGQPVATAQAMLLAEGITSGEVTMVDNATVPLDVVISTDPATGSEVGDDELVNLTVSRGQPVALPPASAVIGQTFDQASQAIQGVCPSPPCLAVTSVPGVNDGVLIDRVITTIPAPGSSVQSGAEVLVVVSRPGGIFDPSLIDAPVLARAIEGLAEECEDGVQTACLTIVPTPAP